MSVINTQYISNRHISSNAHLIEFLGFVIKKCISQLIGKKRCQMFNFHNNEC